jgi:hypothetical protein
MIVKTLQLYFENFSVKYGERDLKNVKFFIAWIQEMEKLRKKINEEECNDWRWREAAWVSARAAAQNEAVEAANARGDKVEKALDKIGLDIDKLRKI